MQIIEKIMGTILVVTACLTGIVQHFTGGGSSVSSEKSDEDSGGINIPPRCDC